MYKRLLSTLIRYTFIPFVLIVIVDYCNIPSFLGIHMGNINYDVFGAIFNAFIVISLYIVTYMIIDRRQIQKDNNAKSVAYELMLSTYKKCIELLKLLDNQNFLSRYIVPKIDFDKLDSDNRVSLNLQNNPFTEYTSLLELAQNGILSGEELHGYIEVMEKYKSYVSLRITFFDIEQSKKTEYTSLKSTLSSVREKLIALLNQETAKLRILVNPEIVL